MGHNRVVGFDHHWALADLELFPDRYNQDKFEGLRDEPYGHQADGTHFGWLWLHIVDQMYLFHQPDRYHQNHCSHRQPGHPLQSQLFDRYLLLWDARQTDKDPYQEYGFQPQQTDRLHKTIHDSVHFFYPIADPHQSVPANQDPVLLQPTEYPDYDRNPKRKIHRF